MKSALHEIEEKVDELLVVLEEDIEHLGHSLSRLNELRSLVIKRDEVSLFRLLEAIGTESQDYRTHELKRHRIREELAGALGCGVEQLTMSRLEAELPGEKGPRLAETKTRLCSLTAELQKEHLSTTMLLQELARFNSVLLNGIFSLCQNQTVTYDANGSASRQTGTAFVDSPF
jgi:flagellar biosynthesis/type III secretory pathway chaperone